MADMTDVADALVGIILAAVYPFGTGQPPAGGVPAKIYQGWPEPQKLKADLAAKIANVSVFPSANVKITTRHFPEWQQLVAPAPTITATAAATTVTLAGAVTLPQAVCLIVDGQDFAYGLQAGDTLTSIAATLAALVNASQPASAAGAVITIPAARRIAARVVANGTSAKEVAREQRVFTVSIWADCFDNREPLAKVITPALANLTRLNLPDGTVATCEYAGSQQIDSEQMQGVFRRDVSVSIDYGTIVTRTDNQVGIVQTNLSALVLETNVPIKTINQ
jgi:hypothetical protein